METIIAIIAYKLSELEWLSDEKDYETIVRWGKEYYETYGDEIDVEEIELFAENKANGNW